MGTKVPTNITEAYKELDKLFAEDPQSKKDFVDLMCAEDVIQYHNTLGRWLRNNWELWDSGILAQFFIKLGIQDPDEMSHRLLEGYWSYCHDIEYDFSFQADEETWHNEYVSDFQPFHF